MTAWREPVGDLWLTGRVLGAEDFPTVRALHHQSLAGQPPGLVNPETDAFLADHLGTLGLTLGLFSADGELVAYAILGLPPAEADYNFGRVVGIRDLGRVAHLDGVAVAPAWRGRGLHRVLVERRLRLAAQAGRRVMVATVAPLNRPSLRTALGAGLRVRAVQPMFASRALRFLVVRDLEGEPMLETTQTLRLPLGATEPLHERLAQGWRGYALDEPADHLLLAVERAGDGS